MTPSRLLLTLLVATAVILPGCLSGSDEEADAEGANATSAPDSDEPLVDKTSPMEEGAVPRGGSDPGSVAHKHDYWAGRTEVVLVDAEFQPRTFCGNSRGTQFQWGCIFVEMGNGSVVYQGTAKLTVVATWNDPKVTGLSMIYRDAGAVQAEPIDIQSGVPLEIPVNPGTADLPHSKESKWAFSFRGGGPHPVGLAWAPVHITITITRGLDLPLDPPHPKFWVDRTEIDLGTSEGIQKAPTAEFVIFGSNVEEPITIPAGGIVPPGTTLLTVHFTWKVKDPQSGVSYRVSPLYRSAQAPYWRWPDEVKIDQNQGQGMFIVEVDPKMTDSPYATESQWKFMLRQYQVESTTGFPVPVSWFGSNPLDRDIEYTFHFTVSNEGGTHVMDDEEMR